MEVLRITRQNLINLVTILTLISLVTCDVQRGEQEGYYAFEEAPSRYMRPPQVRKPPYMRSNIPCPNGDVPYNKRPSPKHTLCGDLNKGFIPMNPMGQDFSGEPYPFELIKNKTLVFLSKALPYLKDDPKIPKVTKIAANKPVPQQFTPHPSHDFRRKIYGHHRIRRANRLDNVTTTLSPQLDNVISNVFENESSARQNCDQGGAAGLFCSLSSAMSNNKIPLALMTAVAQNLVASMSPTTQAPPEVTTPRPQAHLSTEHIESSGSSSPSMTEAVVNLLGTLAHMGITAQGAGSVKDSTLDEEPSTLAHVMSVLTGASPGSSSALSLILKLMASEASPLKALAGGFPSRRRRPVGEDLVAAESSTNVRRPQENDFDLPPTPCPSSEEYVTPTFARNYQGVWKYVVQIPQEGYFTQTVQQTKCMKGRCDFMDGVCHESPRWVSLLVAETYYPDTFFPTSSTPLPPPPPVEDFYNFQQYLKRRVGETDDEANFRSRPVFKEKKPKPQQHCDGVDHIGCYVVRLYYDWFLVNGSCKCWKPSPKRVLTGK